MTMVLDLVLVGIFIVLVVTAAKKGFVLTVLEVVAIVAALFCASYISTPIAQGAYDMFLKNNIIKTIDSEIDEKNIPTNIGDIAFESIPDYAIDFAECAGIKTQQVKTDINNTVATAVERGKTSELGANIEEKCIAPIAVPAIGILIYFIMFTILLIAFRLVAKAVSKSVKLPVIGTMDKVLGGAIGALRGIAVLIIISTVFVTMLSGGDSEFAKAVNESKVIEFINSFNPFVDKLQQLF